MESKILERIWEIRMFHGLGRMLEFEEIDELLGLASGIESNLCYEGKVPIIKDWPLKLRKG